MTTLIAQPARSSILTTLRANWFIYAIDGALLGIFMISACAFVALLEYPASPARRAIDSDFLRRALVGLAMGITALGLIYSPWGKRSGAHMNPAMTLSFLRLGKISRVDACFYIVAQFVGATVGVLLTFAALGMWVSDRTVNFAVTVPGSLGNGIAWTGEFIISFALIVIVTSANKRPKLARFGGCFAAILLVIYITFEAPLSGMSLNPARTFGSAIFAKDWTGWWIYLTAPTLGMLCGIELLRLTSRSPKTLCGKLVHSHSSKCFIDCKCLEGRSNDG
ncbi:aquaporin [soil metagenome]